MEHQHQYSNRHQVLVSNSNDAAQTTKPEFGGLRMVVLTTSADVQKAVAEAQNIHAGVRTPIGDVRKTSTEVKKAYAKLIYIEVELKNTNKGI